MTHILKISEAASLALHSMAYLASRKNGECVSLKEISKRLRASDAHLSKVLQRLAKQGFVVSTRGPKGGFTLAKDASEITLLEILETIEGHLQPSKCLFDRPICDGEQCILADLLEKISTEVHEYLRTKKLSEFRNVFKYP